MPRNAEIKFYSLKNCVDSETSSSDSAMTIFCDFDGPIVDVSDRYYSTYQLALTETQSIYQQQGITLAVQQLTKAQFWQMKQSRTPDPEIAMRSGLQNEEIDVFLECVTEIVNQPFLLHKDRLQPGIQWALALLHSRGARLILVTLRRQTQATQILQNHGLARLFTAIYGTQDDESAYHNYADLKSQLLSEAMHTHNVAPESAWMIGDTEADIIAAKKAGIPSIGLTCGLRSRSYLKQFQPTCIAANLLNAAYYVLEQALIAV